jgi:hypothetical protein
MKIGCDVSEIPTTTNHLESLNNHLKKTILGEYCLQGHLLRADMLCVILVESVIPMILRKRAHQNKIQTTEIENNYVLKRIQEKQLEQQQTTTLIGAVPSFYIQRPCFYNVDNARDDQATRIFNNNQVFLISMLSSHTTILDTLYFNVQSQNILIPNTHYLCSVSFCGFWGCSCDDFQKNSGCCKHVRACFKYIKSLTDLGYDVPDILIPNGFADQPFVSGIEALVF